MELKSQTDQVLEFLQHNPKGITSWQAIKIFNITRLAAHVGFLKKRGYVIQPINESDDKGKHWTRYVLLRDSQNILI